MGGSIGVALFGALFNNLLAGRLGATVAVGEGGFTPDVIQHLPAAQKLSYVSAFASSLTTVFLWATPLMALAFGITWLLHEVPLRSTVHAVDHAREMAAGSAPGTAEPEVSATLVH
jgi:hypothetical protein